MAKLPARQKVNVLIFRHSMPAEILVVQREIRKGAQLALPSVELEKGEPARAGALRLVASLIDSEPMKDFDLALNAEYRVSAGPRAGEWTERFHAVEVATDCLALEGEWFTHYDAKAQAGADSPRVREAVTRLRDIARLKP